MNSVPTHDRIGVAPAMRMPHQRPGVDRGLSRGGPTTADGVEAAFLGNLLKMIPLPKLPNPFDLS